MKKKNKNFLQSEDAQSTVIGVVLIIGILIATSSIYFSIQVPEWTKDYESLHTANVEDDFSEQKTLIDGIKGEIFERTINLKMCPEEVPIYGISPPGSNLDFEPGAEKFEVIVPVGGGGGGSGSWTIPNSGFTDYYDGDNSNKVSVSDDEVTLSLLTAENLILDEEYRALSGGSYYYDEVIITNNSVLSVTPASGVLKIFANNIIVESGSIIDADGCGAPGGKSESHGSGIGKGKKAGPNSDDGGGGAGYGNEGGDGGGTYGGDGGLMYGDETSVIIKAGSGGGGGGNEYDGTGGAGGAGGGGIWLDAEEINIYGTISANGVAGESGTAPGSKDAGGGGGGSGGGILIRGKDVTIPGTATLSANGGDGGDGHDSGDGGGGGAGGRIKIFYELGTVSPGWSVVGGQGGWGSPYGEDGYTGTYYVEQTAYVTSPEIAYYSSGYFVSTVHDTGDSSVGYGEMTWDATLAGQDLVMKVRTDWTENMASATSWDDCPELSSDSGENVIDLSGVGSVSPVAHRYIQYRAELSTDDESETPTLTRTKVNYSFSTQSPTVADASGSIKFRSNYLYYPNQEIVYEHGAVIKYQNEGGFMLQAPPILISNESGIPIIEISLVDLTGANYSYSGGTTTSVKNRFKTYTLFADGLKYPGLTINLTTDYPSVWSNWFDKTLEESGLDDSYFDVSVTGKNVEVDFYGKGDGVELYLEKTAVEVEI